VDILTELNILDSEKYAVYMSGPHGEQCSDGSVLTINTGEQVSEV
jgi:hypothetical protein